MADAPVPPPPPVAIRITRPYATEEEYLERELETLSRAGITLLGAAPRPQGVVLRFELVLTSGHVLMRGEGRVIAFKPNAFEGIGGLTLRFTRLDTRSKALVDKAAALREMRRPSSRPPDPLDLAPRPPDLAPRPPAPAPAIERLSTPGGESAHEASPPAASPPDTSPAPAPAAATTEPPSGPGRPGGPVDAEPPRPAEPFLPAASVPSLPAALAASPDVTPDRESGPVPTGDRDSLLARLRARAKSLDLATVQKLLSARRR